MNEKDCFVVLTVHKHQGTSQHESELFVLKKAIGNFGEGCHKGMMNIRLR